MVLLVDVGVTEPPPAFVVAALLLVMVQALAATATVTLTVLVGDRVSNAVNRSVQAMLMSRGGRGSYDNT